MYVISSYSSPTQILSIFKMKLLNIKFAIEADGGFIKNERSIIYAVKKFLIGSATYWLSSGLTTTQYFLHYGAKENEIFMYPFTSIYRRELTNQISQNEKKDLRKQLGLDETKIAIYAGQYTHRKGIDVLLRAWAKLPINYHLIIIGSGEEEENYKNIIKKNNLLNIKLLGQMDRLDLKKYYLASDLFVLPTREDVWGLVINEAMAWALPIITTEKCIAGIELIKDYENGFIVPTDDAEVLANRISEILGRNELREKMVNANIEKAKAYTIENMAYTHIEIFKKITESEAV